MAAEKEQVISALKATLLSVKGALTIKQCNRDYKELQGEWIPFKKLGYATLDQLFLDAPGFKVTQSNGEWYVDAAASQETQHLAAMVAKQKSSKKSSAKMKYQHRFPPKHDSWRRPASSGNYSSNYSNQYSNQFYRASGGTSYSQSNNHYGSSRYHSKPSRTTETRPPTYVSKPVPKPVEAPERLSTTNKTTNNTTTLSQPHTIKEVIIHNEEPKHSIKAENGIVHAKQSKVSASQRLSTLRERLNTVDIIPLQLPAVATERKNAVVERNASEKKQLGTIVDEQKENYVGPHVAPAQALEPPPDSSSPVDKLEWTCRKLGLPQPVYKVQDQVPKRGHVIYFCSVKVGSTYQARSYPDSASSQELAKDAAAVKMLAEIESSETGGLPTSTAGRAMACLSDLVADHDAGLWASTVPHCYRAKYGENLPQMWQEMLPTCPRIKVEFLTGLMVLVPNSDESTIPRLEAHVFEETIDTTDLPPLQFPGENVWNVFVTVANSTLEVWLRIIGPEYSDTFEILLASMSEYYQVGGTPVDETNIVINAWYAVNLEDGGWQRAKVLEVADGSAAVFLGDHGDDDVVTIDNIRLLEPQFRQLPAQAILCRLEGATELAKSNAACALVRRLLQGESLVAQPGPRENPADPAVAVVLYDTSTNQDLNLNDAIVDEFCAAGMFTITQKPCEVEVGCVTEDGRVWVCRAGGGAVIRNALSLLTAGQYRRPLPASPPAPPPPQAAAPAARPLFIVRTLDGDWVRCTIISALDGEGTVRTQLIDSGLVLRAPLSSLVPLSSFSPALNKYPPQALQVRLGEAADRAAAAMVSRLREMLLKTSVLCRAMPAPAAAAGPPHVDLFVRTGQQNILASVNNAIVMEYDFLQLGKPQVEIEPESNHVEQLHRKKERIFRSTSSVGDDIIRSVTPQAGALPAPVLPPVGKCIDLYIAMAANPWNFVVQPNSTRPTLLAMMESLQNECPKLPESSAPVKPAKGELYTVFYVKDSSWYRVIIAGCVSVEMVSVYFCDYGDLALFPNEQLRPVPSTVPLARGLPPQAIKARLHDIYPQHQDWSVEDCIRFQELCVEQQFVGICKNVGRDPLNASEPLLTLELIDTTTDEDIYLNRVLVSEGRARHAAGDE